MDEITATSWVITPQLRWLRRFEDGHLLSPVLQQAWRCVETGVLEWRNVEFFGP